ncbi:Amidase [Achromobacter xylosoxidans]|nr:Amidase [Achromobacter xylosoxidans]
MFRSYYETLNVRARTVAATAPFDYVLSPVAPVVAYNAEWAAPTNEVATTMHHIGYTLPYNMSEQPAASVNCGYTRAGLPIGLQIAGARFDDLGVLRVARAWERMRPAQQPWPQPPRAA